MTTTRQGGSGRLERLRAGVAGKGRSQSQPVARWLMIAGAGMGALGILMIVMGWLGAARTPYVFEQVPYLISGGLLGLALAVLGGLFYFAYWMTRALEESRAQSDRTIEMLGRLEALLMPRNGSTPAKAANGSPFVRTGKGTMFHRPDCTVVAGRDDLSAVDAEADGFEPCRICDPLGAH